MEMYESFSSLITLREIFKMIPKILNFTIFVNWFKKSTLNNFFSQCKTFFISHCHREQYCQLIKVKSIYFYLKYPLSQTSQFAHGFDIESFLTKWKSFEVENLKVFFFLFNYRTFHFHYPQFILHKIIQGEKIPTKEKFSTLS